MWFFTGAREEAQERGCHYIPADTGGHPGDFKEHRLGDGGTQAAGTHHYTQRIPVEFMHVIRATGGEHRQAFDGRGGTPQRSP